ncbi:MAG: hypothetical protein OXC05_13115 [Halieaceae bacterium]|nr:hypothetical protein [Halieaceae bacterium]
MTILLNHNDIEGICSPQLAFDAMQRAFTLEGNGEIGKTIRTDVETSNGWLRQMSVSADGLGCFGFKAMNLTRGVGVRYAIWLYDAKTGDLRVILDARHLTGTRTAATTAVATSYLANPVVERVAIIGSGFEAREHLVAFHSRYPEAEFAVYSRSADNRAAYIERMAGLNANLRNCDSMETALEYASVVILGTKSPTAFFEAGHIAPGVHVNSIGAARHDQAELTVDACAGFDLLCCDNPGSVLSEAGDAVAAVEAGAIDQESAIPLASIVAEKTAGRTGLTQATLFKSVGTAVQDIVLAQALVEEAERLGLGTPLDGFPSLKAF